MKFPCALRCLLLSFGLVVCLPARAATPNGVPRPPLPDYVQRELDIVSTARAAVLRGDFAAAGLALAAAPDARLNIGTSAALPRRAVEVCAGFRNRNQYGLAMKLATQVLGQLDTMTEASDADRVERYYWSAYLEGEVLGRPARALELLQVAEQIAPADERVVELKRRMTAIVSFGY